MYSATSWSYTVSNSSGFAVRTFTKISSFLSFKMAEYFISDGRMVGIRGVAIPSFIPYFTLWSAKVSNSGADALAFKFNCSSVLLTYLPLRMMQ
ncbi:hypothetical protein D3C77_618830 [compost metagenome]